MTITPTTTMLTKNTTELRDLVRQHVAAGQVTQGAYWDPEKHRGCFIGCLSHSKDPSGAENEFGLPIMVQRIAESIFEALPASEAKDFFAALPDAVGCDGKDLSRVGWQFLAAELRSLPEQPAEIQAVIDPVIAGLELLAAGREWPAKSAEAAARTAARIAGKAAAWSPDAAETAETAETAGWTGWATGWATDAAGWAAAEAASGLLSPTAVRQRQRDLLLRLIAEAPVVGEAHP
jgi:hypothetical protein